MAGAFVVGVDLGPAGRSSSRFVVTGPGFGAGEASEFVAWLAFCGRRSYTQRTYALGLAHFLSWIDRRGVGLVDVDRRVVGEYVVAFRDGSEDGLALGRQPRTVNHRLCVLASFFEFIERRDRDRGFGVWGDRPCPVPVGHSPMEGLMGCQDPAWVMFRRGHGRPLSYPAFECSLRHLCRKVGVHVTAHMFRRALAQAVVDVAGLKVAQEMLGHAHISTTADTYSHVDEQAMVAAVERVRDLFDLRAATNLGEGTAGGYVFPYDPTTLAELDAAADIGLGEEPRR